MITTGNKIGPYEVQELLGNGGMAAVYRAWHTVLQRHEAIKVLSPGVAHQPSVVERFLSEARTVAKLEHANIATIHAIGAAGTEWPYFTMELVEGGNLAQLITARGRLPMQEALSLLRQIAAALDYAHQHGLLHRDVKPANILLKPVAGGYLVKVVDFGIAKSMADNEQTRLTQTGTFLGTPEYMSPEQAGNGERIDRRTDQYSLAVLAYELLCGVPPFQGNGDTSMIGVLMKHARESALPPSHRNPSLPGPVDGVILRALAKKPEQRFASCGEFVEALAAAATGSVAQAPVATPASSPVRKPLPLIPLAAGFVVLAGIGLIGFGMLGAQNKETVVPGDTFVNVPVESLSPPAETAAPTPAPTPTPRTAAVQNRPAALQGERYPYTRTRYLSDSEVDGLNYAQVRYALNEMYARHGYDFKTRDIKQHFRRFSWYRPVAGRSQPAVEKLMSHIERANVKRLTLRRSQLQ